jgi:hypothetical protein
MPPRISALILIVLCALGLLLTAGCQSVKPPRKDAGNAPTVSTDGITRSVSDGKTALAEAQDSARGTDGFLRSTATRQERIDYKAQIISDYFHQ